MNREVEREKRIPAFSIKISELEALWVRLSSLFDDTQKILGSINITLPKEKLEFVNIEELKNYSNLKGVVTNFSLSLSQSGRRIYISSGSFVTPKSVVSANSETEAWCAGAVETVLSFLRSYKVWYSWIASAPLGWILIIFANVPSIASQTLPKGTIGELSLTGWIATLVALVFLYLFRWRLFPAATLCITDEEGFVKRHSPELSLIIALISVALTLISLFLKK
jgi:hypothetical protein